MKRLWCLGLALVAAPGATAKVVTPPSIGASGVVVVGGELGVREDGRVHGWFVVRNEGGPVVREIRARLTLGGRTRVWRLGSLAAAELRKVHLSLAAPAHPTRARLCVWSVRRARGEGLAPYCRGLGMVPRPARVPGGQGGSGSGRGPAPPPPGAPGGAPAVPESSFPSDPIAFEKGVVFELHDPASEYWAYVPQSYDTSNQTPTELFVWLHGCEGEGRWDIYNVSPGGTQDWISIAVGGEEGGCWDPAADQGKVLAAIADLKTHFNVDPKRVVLGGYSSGGDLSYRLAFEHSSQFAGILVENTTPFRDTGLSRAEALADASWRFHVVQLAHLQDTTYPIATVREETGAMLAAGFPLALIERNGHHYDSPGAKAGGEKVPGTEADVRTYLLPYLDAGWRAP